MFIFTLSLPLFLTGFAHTNGLWLPPSLSLSVAHTLSLLSRAVQIQPTSWRRWWTAWSSPTREFPDRLVSSALSATLGECFLGEWERLAEEANDKYCAGPKEKQCKAHLSASVSVSISVSFFLSSGSALWTCIWIGIESERPSFLRPCVLFFPQRRTKRFFRDYAFLLLIRRVLAASKDECAKRSAVPVHWSRGAAHSVCVHVCMYAWAEGLA